MNEGNDDENAPQPVYHARNSGEHLHRETHDLPHRQWKEIFAQKNCDRETQGQRKKQSDQRTHRCSDEERRHAVNIPVWNPLRVRQEIETKFLN